MDLDFAVLKNSSIRRIAESSRLQFGQRCLTSSIARISPRQSPMKPFPIRAAIPWPARDRLMKPSRHHEAVVVTCPERWLALFNVRHGSGSF